MVASLRMFGRRLSTIGALAFVILTMLTGSPSWSQVNVEQYREDKSVMGVIGVSGGGAAGNSEYFSTGASIRLSLRDSANAFLVVGDGLVGFAGGKRFYNDGLLHLRLTRIKYPKFKPEVFFQSDYNLQRLLSSRFLFGAGLRTHIVDRNNLSVYIGNSLMGEHERLDLPTGSLHPETTSVIRSSNYVNVRMGSSEDWNFSTVGYYQPDLAAPGDYRLLAVATLSNKLFGPIAQTATVRFRRDSEPPDGAKKRDVSVSFGLEWRKGE